MANIDKMFIVNYIDVRKISETFRVISASWFTLQVIWNRICIISDIFVFDFKQIFVCYNATGKFTLQYFSCSISLQSISQLTFNCSKSKIETLEKSLKFVQN